MKKLYSFAICALLFGLVACTNDNAFDPKNEHGTFNVNNSPENTNNYVRDQNLTRSPEHDDRGINNVDRDGNNIDFGNENQGRVDDNLNISSMKTNLSSNKYPHTKAVLLSEAKYKFIKIDPRQAAQLQGRLQQQAQGLITQQEAQQPAETKQQPAPTQQQAPAKQAAQNNAPANISQAAQKVIELTNIQRRNNGLPELKADTQLSSVAQKKSTDMAQKNYFSHTSPTYGSPFDMMRDFGVTYRTAGENIAQGQTTPEQVVQSWMNSAGHRKNILSRDFTHIGVGYDASGHHWTQMFIGK